MKVQLLEELVANDMICGCLMRRVEATVSSFESVPNLSGFACRYPEPSTGGNTNLRSARRLGSCLAAFCRSWRRNSRLESRCFATIFALGVLCFVCFGSCATMEKKRQQSPVKVQSAFASEQSTRAAYVKRERCQDMAGGILRLGESRD